MTRLTPKELKAIVLASHMMELALLGPILALVLAYPLALAIPLFALLLLALSVASYALPIFAKAALLDLEDATCSKLLKLGLACDAVFFLSMSVAFVEGSLPRGVVGFFFKLTLLLWPGGSAILLLLVASRISSMLTQGPLALRFRFMLLCWAPFCLGIHYLPQSHSEFWASFKLTFFYSILGLGFLVSRLFNRLRKAAKEHSSDDTP